MTRETRADEGGRSRRPVSFRHRFEFVALRVFMGAVRLFGLGIGYRIAPLAARVYETLDRRHVRIAAANLHQRFGLEPAAARKMAHACYTHFFKCLVEMLLFDRTIEREGLSRVLVLDGEEHMTQALARGKGVILATGHLGNWEVIARAGTSRGWKVTTVYRPLDNPLIDDLIRQFRSSHDQVLALKHGALKSMLTALRKGEVAVLMVDQDARRRGVFVPFLGHPASTIRTPAELALRTGASLLTAFSNRTGPGFRHHVRVDPPVDTTPSGDREADVMRIMTDVNRNLEAALRRAPEQWLWPHRRWKSVQRAGESRPGRAGARKP